RYIEEIFPVIRIGNPWSSFRRGLAVIFGVILIVHLTVEFWSPSRTGTESTRSVFRSAVRVIQILLGSTLAVFVLIVRPAVNKSKGSIARKTNAETLLNRTSLFGSNDNRSIGTPGTI